MTIAVHPFRTMSGGPARSLQRALLVSILLLCADHAWAAPVLVNGSMTGTVGADTAPDGWTKANSTPDVVDAAGPFNNTGVDWALSPDGGTFARLNGTGDPAFREALEQTVDGFEPGTSYSLDFYVTNLGFFFAAGDEWRDRPGFIELYVDDVLVGQSGTVFAPATRLDSIQWTADGIAFVASNASHTIRVLARTADAGGATAYIGVDGAELVLAGTTTTSIPTTSTSSIPTSSTTTSTSSSTTTSSTVTTSSTSTSLIPTTSSSSSTTTTSTTSSTTTTLGPGSTTTTSTSTSTSTTAPPSCLPGGCDDGDACTIDACEAGFGCVATPVPGLAGVLCRLEQLTATDLCGPEPIDPKLTAFVGTRVERALRALAQALEATKERTTRKRIRKIGRQLKKIARRVAKFERKERITPACAAAFQSLLCRLVSETDVPELQQSPCPF